MEIQQCCDARNMYIAYVPAYVPRLFWFVIVRTTVENALYIRFLTCSTTSQQVGTKFLSGGNNIGKLFLSHNS